MGSIMHWLVLGAAVLAETIGTTALQASQQFTRFWPSVLVVVAYAISFYLLSMTLRVMPVGVRYARKLVTAVIRRRFEVA